MDEKSKNTVRKLAKIDRASLYMHGRGFLTFGITVSYEDGGEQQIGNLVLDAPGKPRGSERAGTRYGCEMIIRILNTLGVSEFPKMAGMHIWVHGEGDFFDFRATGIEPLNLSGIKAKPLFFDDVAKECSPSD